MADRIMLLPSRFPDAQPLLRPVVALPQDDLAQDDLAQDDLARDDLATDDRAETVEPSRRPVLLSWAVKLCLMVALVGFGASQYLSWMIGTAGTQRDSRLARNVDDPETTGSIADAARGVAIDPCAASLRLKGTR